MRPLFSLSCTFLLIVSFAQSVGAQYYTMSDTLTLSGVVNRHIVVADFNRDGRPDLLLGGTTGSELPFDPIRLLISNGDGTLVDSTAHYIEGTHVFAWPVGITADFNNDGVFDVAIFDQGKIPNATGNSTLGQEPVLLLSTPAGTWANSSALADAYRPTGTDSVAVKWYSLTAADIDNDNDVDIWTEAWNNPPTLTGGLLGGNWFINDGDGTFSLECPSYNGCAVGDERGPSAYILGGENGFWRYQSCGLVDVNNDTYVDLIFGQLRRINNQQEELASKVMLNDGSGNFKDHDSHDLPYATWHDGWTYVKAFTAINLNDDEWIDLVLAHERGGDEAIPAKGNTGFYLQFLVNNGGDGTFSDMTASYICDQSATTTFTGNTQNRLVAVDMNNDGLEDLVMVNGSNITTEAPFVFLNNGTHFYSAIDPSWITMGQNFGANSYPIDLNGDDLMDVVTATLFDGDSTNVYSEVVSILSVSAMPVVPCSTFTLDVAVSGNGNVARSPDQEAYDDGTVVTLTAAPDSGWSFLGWSGDTGAVAQALGANVLTRSEDAGDRNVTLLGNRSPTLSSSHELALTMSRGRNVGAIFASDAGYALDVTVVGSGSVTKTPDQATYVHGTMVTMEATPAIGWHFVGWTGGATGATSPVDVEMNQERAVTATFAVSTYYDIQSASKATINDWVQEYLSVSDFNGDGREDLLLGGANFAAIPPYLLVNNGDGTLTDSTAHYFPGAPPFGQPLGVTADFNNDGTVDVAIFDQLLESAPGLLLSTPGGTWANSSALADAVTGAGGSGTLYIKAAAAGDINDDTYVDLWVDSGNLDPHFMINNGDGTFTVDFSDARRANALIWGPTGNWRHASATLVDVNDDTYPDLVLGQERSKSNNQDDLASKVILNDGSGHFVTPNSNDLPYPSWYDGFTHVKSIVVMNLNGDALPDVVFGHTRGSGEGLENIGFYQQFLVNNGDGTFNDLTASFICDQSATASETVSYGNFAKQLLARDMNDDGMNDLVMGAVNEYIEPDVPFTFLHNGVGFHSAIDPEWITMGQGGFGTHSYPLHLNDDALMDMVTISVFDVGSGNEYSEVTPILAASAMSVIPCSNFNLAVTVVGDGSVGKSPDQEVYDDGTMVTLTAVPDSGWSFVGWSGSASGSTNPLDVVMDVGKTIFATFASTHTLDITLVGDGSVAKNPDETIYVHGTTVTLTPTAATEWNFAGWSGDTGATVLPQSLEAKPTRLRVGPLSGMSRSLMLGKRKEAMMDRSLRPGAKAVAHPIELVHPLLPDEPIAKSLERSLTSGALVGANDLVLLMDRARSVTATFEINTYALDVTVVGDGSVVTDPDLPAHNYGSTVTLTATPGMGKSFGFWSGDASGSENPLMVTMDSTKLITANFGIVSVDDPPVTEFALTLVSPNPSTGITRIEFTVPTAARVRLSLYDLQGREVEVLASDLHQPGRYQKVWSGLVGRRRAPAGVYFVRYRTPGRDFVRRLAMTR